MRINLEKLKSKAQAALAVANHRLGFGDEENAGFSLLLEEESQGSDCAESASDPREAEVVLLLVLNGGEQNGVPPFVLRDTLLKHEQPAGLRLLVSRPDWPFAATLVTPSMVRGLSTTQATPNITLGLFTLPSWALPVSSASNDRPPSVPPILYLARVARGTTVPSLRTRCPELFRVWHAPTVLPPAPSSSSKSLSVPLSVPAVPGLRCLENAISPEVEAELLDSFGVMNENRAGKRHRSEKNKNIKCGAGGWEVLNNRRVYHVGKRLVFGSNTWEDVPEDHAPSAAMAAGIAQLRRLAEEHASSECGARPLDQCTLNWYEAGDGIPPHTDDVDSFGPTIAVVSLASDIVMLWHPPTCARSPVVPVLLPRRSVVWFEGPARFEWRHSIVERQTDHVLLDDTGVRGYTLPRSKRVSVTFRHANTP